jgi:serine/threonine protein kinase
VVVADWGESRTNSEKNTTGRGTYNISAPDVFGKENYNLEVDIWSFGSLMYEVIWNKELITRREFYQLVALPS